MMGHQILVSFSDSEFNDLARLPLNQGGSPSSAFDADFIALLPVVLERDGRKYCRAQDVRKVVNILERARKRASRDAHKAHGHDGDFHCRQCELDTLRIHSRIDNTLRWLAVVQQTLRTRHAIEPESNSS